MNPRCPYYKPPRYIVFADEKGIERDCEGSAWCELSDKYCLVEYDNDCEIYNEFLEEQSDENGNEKIHFSWMTKRSPSVRSRKAGCCSAGTPGS